jgi:hypothetical protein
VKPAILPPGPHPGFSRLKSRPNVYRCKLRAELNKAKPEHADYSRILQLDGGKKAFVRLWTHVDGSLGLRVELNPPEKRKAT